MITASDTPQTVDEVSKALTVVADQEIDERDESAIPEALRIVPGLRVQQLGGPGSLTSIKTRGLPSEDTAVLIDGIRFRDAAAPQGDASGFLEDLIVTDVSRVEVLRGSGSSLYGSNAVGGVVNIVTNEGGGPIHGSVLGEGGGLGLFRTRAQLAGGLNNNRVVYSGGFSFFNVSRGIDDEDEARNTSGQGRILFRLTPTATLTGRIYTANSRLQLNNNPEAIGTLPATGIIEAIPFFDNFTSTGVPSSYLNLPHSSRVNDPDNVAKRTSSMARSPSRNARLKLSATRSVTRVSSQTAAVSMDHSASAFNRSAARRDPILMRAFTRSTRVSIYAPDISTTLPAATSLRTRALRTRRFRLIRLIIRTSTSRNEATHFFVQDQLRFLDDRLQIAAAFRTQLFRLQDPQFTPAASAPYAGITFQSPPTAYTGDGSIAYTFRSTGTKLRGHVGNGYRAPSLFERFGTAFDSFFGYSIFGDPRLKPEHSVAFDAGIDQTFADNRVRLSATYFYTELRRIIIFDFSGLIDFTTDPFGRFGGYLNTDGGIARGAEVELRATPFRTLNLTAAYTFTKAQQRTPQVPGTIRSLVIPDHQFSIVATQHVGRRVLINFDFSASSNYLGAVIDPTTFTSRGFRFQRTRES